jgi:hypothetical protein
MNEQAVVGESDVKCILCGRFTLHQRHDVIKTAESTRPNSKNENRQGLLNRARVSNAPDRPATRLRLGPRRDRVAKRPDSGRTTAWANVEGRHLLCGFVGRLQPRSPDFPREHVPMALHDPFLLVPRWTKQKSGPSPITSRVLPYLDPRSPWHHEKGPSRVRWRRGRHGPGCSAGRPLRIGALTCATCTLNGIFVFATLVCDGPPGPSANESSPQPRAAGARVTLDSGRSHMLEGRPRRSPGPPPRPGA